jgi:surface protein
MFSGCSSLENLDVTGFKTDNVIMMSEMFKDCSSLTTLDLSNFKTENVGYMDFMFYGCSHLSSLDLSGFRTDNAKSMYGMFTNCSNLTSLDVSSFRTDKVTNMGLMFGFCPNLSSLDLSEFKTDNVTNMLQMFGYCNNLETIYVSDAWNTEKVEMGFSMFDSCYNLVGGAGTLFSQNHTGLDYAHIDGGPSNPGYLTYKESTNIAHTKKITEESGYIYSLSGIKLRSATKGTKGLKPGVYVMGGKKIVVK